MQTNNNMTFFNLLGTLHKRLLDAREQKDQKSLRELLTTFGVLSETCEPGPLVGILTNLECAARDALMGEDWKSEIPSVEEIRSALSLSGK